MDQDKEGMRTTDPAAQPVRMSRRDCLSAGVPARPQPLSPARVAPWQPQPASATGATGAVVVDAPVRWQADAGRTPVPWLQAGVGLLVAGCALGWGGQPAGQWMVRQAASLARPQAGEQLADQSPDPAAAQTEAATAAQALLEQAPPAAGDAAAQAAEAAAQQAQEVQPAPAPPAAELSRAQAAALAGQMNAELRRAGFSDVSVQLSASGRATVHGVVDSAAGRRTILDWLNGLEPVKEIDDQISVLGR